MLSSRLSRLHLNKILYCNNLKLEYVIFRTITTSKKNSDATAAASVSKGATESVVRGANQGKWQTYGFALTEKEDKFHMHMVFFFGVTICLVLASFYIAYSPNELDWVQREAFLELRRREELGLPLIDKNFIDPKLIKLPSDDELLDTEIII